MKKIFILMSATIALVFYLFSCETYERRISPPPAPTLLSPSNGTTGVSTTPTFQWSAVSGATSYHLQVSVVSDFSTMVIDESGLSTTSHAVSSALANGTYYWRVRSSNAGGPGNWTSPWSFTITTNTVTDIDGNVYHTVTIGTQVWMVENLKTTRYRNGTAIPNVTDGTAWSGLSTGAYCDYNNSSANGVIYGHLYNWYAVNNSNNIAPTGWHVPTDADWTTLTTYLGGESVAGGKLKEAGTSHWSSPNTGATNETGFTALPGGYRYDYGPFNDVGGIGFWWSATEYGAASARGRSMGYRGANVYRSSSYKRNGFSVRCVRD